MDVDMAVVDSDGALELLTTELDGELDTLPDEEVLLMTELFES